jgi:hypothetical protein
LKSKRSAAAPANLASEATASPGGIVRAWTDFWFTPISPAGLHVLRILAGLLFLGWLLPLAGHREALFGLEGYFDRQAYLEMRQLVDGPPVPIGWSLLYWVGSNPAVLDAFYWGVIALLVLFTLGIATRVTAVAAWLIVVSCLASPVTRFEADYLLGMLAFYLMIGYLLLGQWDGNLSLWQRLLGTSATWVFRPLLATREPAAARPSYAANLAVRLVQVHVAVVVVVSGLHKLQFGDWWAGVAFWYPLHPPYQTTAASLKAEALHATSLLFWLSLVQYLVLAWQLGFPLFAWRRRWRPVLLGGAAVGWVGSMALYRLPLFGPVFLIGCLSYLTPEEWHRAGTRLVQWAKQAAAWLAPAADKNVKLVTRA